MTVSYDTSKHPLSFPYKWTPVLTLGRIADLLAHVDRDLHIPEEIKKHLVGRDEESLILYRACLEGTRCRRTKLPYHSHIRSLPAHVQQLIVDSIDDERNESQIDVFELMLRLSGPAPWARFIESFDGREFAVHPRLAALLVKSKWRDDCVDWETGLKKNIDGHLMPLQQEYDREGEAKMLSQLCPEVYQVPADRESAVRALADAYKELLDVWPDMFDYVKERDIIPNVPIERLDLYNSKIECSIPHLQQFGPRLSYLKLQLKELSEPDQLEEVFKQMCTLVESMTELKTLKADFLDFDKKFALCFLQYVSRNSSITKFKLKCHDRVKFPPLSLCKHPTNPSPFQSLHKLALHKVTFDEAIDAGFELPNVRVLQVSKVSCTVNPAGFLNQFPLLEELHIFAKCEFYMSNEDDWFEGIWTEQIELPRLQKLALGIINIWNTGQDEDQIEKIHRHVHEWVLRLPLLTDLYLSEIEHFGPNVDKMKEFFNYVIPRMQNLTKLELHGCLMDEDACKTLVKNLQASSASQLTSLSLRLAYLKPSSIKHLVKLFPSTPLLQRLDVSHNNLTAAALIELLKHLKKLPKLSVLDLVKQEMYRDLYTVPTFQQFCNNLKKLTSLKTLCIEYDECEGFTFPPEIPGIMGDAVASLKSLRELRIPDDLLKKVTALV